MDPKTRKLLMTIRAALVMATRAIEVYCGVIEEKPKKVMTDGDTVTLST